MSLLDVAKAVHEEVGLPTPSAVISSSDRSVKKLLRLINRSGKRLAKKDWTILQREHTFATVNGTASYNLPADFDRLLDSTCWNRDTYWQLRGPLNARDWQIKKSALVATTSLRQNFRIRPDSRVNKFYIDPTPTLVEDMVFEYASAQWVKDSGNTVGKSAYALDTDISLIAEELIELDVIWRLLNRNGFAYAEERDEADRAIAEAFASDRAVSVLDFGGISPVPVANIPEGNFPEPT